MKHQIGLIYFFEDFIFIKFIIIIFRRLIIKYPQKINFLYATYLNSYLHFIQDIKYISTPINQIFSSALNIII